jgi:uncharacterized protein
MTKVIFKKKNNLIVAFKIKGHTGYDEAGRDIVCSAISTLSCSIGDGIIEILKVTPEYSVEDGFLSLSLEKVSGDDVKKSQVLLETLLLGLKNIETMYGKYIKVKIEEV